MNEKGWKYEYLFLTLISILFIITMGLSACAKPAPAPSPAPAPYPAPAPAPAPAPVPMPAIKINTISEACDAVDNYIYDLAKTPEAKRLLAEYKDNMWSPNSCVVVVDYDQQRKLVYSEWHYEGWDVKQYIIQHIFDSEFTPGSEVLSRILGTEECIYGCGPDDEATYPVTWIVDTYTGTVSPENSNAARIVAELMEPTVSVTPPPSLSPTPVNLPPPPRYFPITDVFILSPFDEEASSKYTGWFISQYPFNEFGGYVNRFSFEADETLDIVITSDQPISIEECDELWGGIYADIHHHYSETSYHTKSSWYESCDVYKSGNNWEARLTFSPDQTGIYSLSFVNRSGKSAWCQYTISLHAASSTKKINTESEATAAVLDYLSSLATTSDAKQFLAEFQDNVWDTGFLVFDSRGVSHSIEDYQGQDVYGYAVEFAFPEEATLHGVLRNEITAGWQGNLMYIKLCSWLVELDGTVQPRDSNALRVEIRLTSSTTLVWTYPELRQLGISAEPDFFHETVPREVLENPAWEPKELEERVIELAREYEKANPYVEPNHVCEHMALELWQVLKDNNITSLIVVGNTENQKEWRIKFECNHAWLVVLGRNNLNLGVECTSGIVYSPSYIRAFELGCEFACREYGPSSPQWETAKAPYDYFYTDYEQHLEGYFYRSPTAFYGSKALWFIPSNW